MRVIIANTNFDSTTELLRSKYSILSEDGCFFAILRTEYDSYGNVMHDFFDVIEYADNIGYQYINTIVFPLKERQYNSFSDNVGFIVWLAKDRTKMRFNKDPIRESHIWEKVEWGGRKKNYNPKGKDPGNVWIPTEDDGNANITKHLLLDLDSIINRLVLMTESQNDYVLYNGPKDFSNRELSIDEYCSTVKNSSIFNKVFFGTSENMHLIPDALVSVIVTSPPYWDLKDYYKEGQTGQENYDAYLTRMLNVWTECYHKLNTDGSLWININTRMKNGKMIPLPHDFIKMCRGLGFYYKGIIVWHKSSGIPTNDKNLSDHHEYVLLFSKKQEFSVKRLEFSAISDYKNDEINGGAFWNINRKAGSVGKKYIHPAIYPNELVDRIIRLSSNESDIVLDPFLGSGTSLIAAAQNNRSFYGYEFNENFRGLMESRFSSEIPSCKVDFIYDL